MAAYVVTGGTGFIGRRLVAELAKRKEPVHVLVREQSAGKLKGAGRSVKPLLGDITRANLGVSKAELAALKGAEVFHLAAVYDLEASEDANQKANVEGTRHVVAFANAIKARRLHHQVEPAAWMLRTSCNGLEPRFLTSRTGVRWKWTRQSPSEA